MPRMYHEEPIARTISYLCDECLELLNLSGFVAVNEVGRKYCEGCGNNDDNLTVVDAVACAEAISTHNRSYSE